MKKLGVGAILLLLVIAVSSIATLYAFFTSSALSYNVKVGTSVILAFIAFLLIPYAYKKLSPRSSRLTRGLKAVGTSLLMVGGSVGWLAILFACMTIDGHTHRNGYNRYTKPTSATEEFVSFTSQVLFPNQTSNKQTNE